MTDKCESCKEDFDTPFIAKAAVSALGLEGFCGDCVGRGIKWAIKSSKK